jgi:hypothetical protein
MCTFQHCDNHEQSKKILILKEKAEIKHMPTLLLALGLNDVRIIAHDIL